MALHSLNIFLVSNLSALKFLSSLLYLFLIYRSSLGKILLEDRCCFHCSLSAMSSKDLQNRILFPVSPLLASMKTPSPCLMWKSWMLLLEYWLSAVLLLSALNFCFYLSSLLLHKTVSSIPQMLQSRLCFLLLMKLLSLAPNAQKLLFSWLLPVYRQLTSQYWISLSSP